MNIIETFIRIYIVLAIGGLVAFGIAWAAGAGSPVIAGILAYCMGITFFTLLTVAFKMIHDKVMGMFDE